MDVAAELKELSATLASIEKVLDLDKLRREAAELEQQASAPDLWDDPDKAQKVTSRLSYAQGEIRRVEDLRRRTDDAALLWDMAEEADDADSRAEAEAEGVGLRRAIDELEVRTLLSGPYDARGRGRLDDPADLG
ncbi:MAG: PCRF domain-containing protein, partial [Jatrophihabitantaceae bacterium]